MATKTADTAPAALHNAFAEELRMEGIAHMGYGVLPKYVMLDSDLTIEAKAIYAYLCSYTGQGNTAFPGRDRILADLQVNKDTYYRHYKLLLDEGYLTVQQTHSDSGFARNIYTLVATPEKFRHATARPHLEKTYATIRISGLKAAGYGFIPKAVMIDPRLSLKAKGLYAYFCAFTGAGENAHPSLDTAKHHLGISRPLYAKYAGELRSFNYIAVTQRITAGGRFSVNDVTIIDAPNMDQASTRHCFSREEESFLYVDFSDTRIPPTYISDTGKSVTQKADNKKKQEKKNNKISSDKQSFQQQQHPNAGAKKERTGRQEIIAIKDILWETQSIPTAWLGDRGKIGESLNILTDYQHRLIENPAETEPGSSYLLMLEALTDMLCAGKPMQLTGDTVKACDVSERLTRYIHRSYTRGTAVLYDLVELVQMNYEEGCRNQPVRNPLAYCKACIWTALKTGDAAIRAQVSHDLGY